MMVVEINLLYICSIGNCSSWSILTMVRFGTQLSGYWSQNYSVTAHIIIRTCSVKRQSHTAQLCWSKSWARNGPRKYNNYRKTIIYFWQVLMHWKHGQCTLKSVSLLEKPLLVRFQLYGEMQLSVAVTVFWSWISMLKIISERWLIE